MKSLDGPSGTEVDFTDLHAWCEVYLPGAGWIGLDPTSGLLAGEGHIPLACSPEPVVGRADHRRDRRMRDDVRAPHDGDARVGSAARHRPTPTRSGPRSTRSAAQVDADLRRSDVRLTQGGEPTFVSIDDRDGAEWNTEALGPTKRLLARRADGRGCKRKYGASGLLHYGQGKWYPGEQLPRWSLNLFWRKDGEPLWTNPALFADEHERLRRRPTTQARAFLQRARASGSASIRSTSFPAYEDVWYYLWRERKLPANVDPFDARLDDPLERERLRNVFEQGLDSRRRPRAAARAQRREPTRCALAERPVVPARRALLPDARRFADGLPPAARLAAVGRDERLPVAASGRPDAAVAAPLPPYATTAHATAPAATRGPTASTPQ